MIHGICLKITQKVRKWRGLCKKQYWPQADNRLSRRFYNTYYSDYFCVCLKFSIRKNFKKMNKYGTWRSDIVKMISNHFPPNHPLTSISDLTFLVSSWRKLKSFNLSRFLPTKLKNYLPKYAIFVPFLNLFCKIEKLSLLSNEFFHIHIGFFSFPLSKEPSFIFSLFSLSNSSLNRIPLADI